MTAWHMTVNNGGVRGKAEILCSTGGTSFFEDAHENLVLSRLTKSTVLVHRSGIRTFSPLSITGVWLRRHEIGGGSLLVITWFKFGAGSDMRIVQATCLVKSVSLLEVFCSMPSQAAPGSYIVPV